MNVNKTTQVLSTIPVGLICSHKHSQCEMWGICCVHWSWWLTPCEVMCRLQLSVCRHSLKHDWYHTPPTSIQAAGMQLEQAYTVPIVLSLSLLHTHTHSIPLYKSSLNASHDNLYTSGPICQHCCPVRSILCINKQHRFMQWYALRKR